MEFSLQCARTFSLMPFHIWNACEFLLQQYVFRTLDIGSLQCKLINVCILDENEIVFYFISIKDDIELPGRFRSVGIGSLQCMLMNICLLDENEIVFYFITI